MPAAKSPLISSLIKVLGALAVSGSVFWFLYSSLAPVEVPQPPPSRKALTFDTRADVSQNRIFTQLHSLAENLDLKAKDIGRPNPFMPIPKPQALPAASSTTSTTETPTSTPSMPSQP